MKLTLLLLLVGLVGAKGNIHGQQISLNLTNQPLGDVCTAIEKQSNYVFFISSSVDKTKPVTIKVQSVSIDEVLKLLLKDLALDYAIKGKTITIIKKEPKQSTAINVTDPKPPIEVLVRVTNEEGEPVAGVTVQIKGGKIAGATNEDGVVRIKVESNAILVLTAVNIIAQEADVKGQKEVHVRVKGRTGKLDEVQVIAYGKTSPRLNTGNVTTVNGSDIEKQPVNNPLLALQGRVPGLLITQASGLSGTAVSVRIQGQNSIGRGSEPLYVIDGVPYGHELLPTLTNDFGPRTGFDVPTTGSGSPFNFINPADIESINILKDADATAIYGSRAANGAILITTKKGKVGQTKVEFTIQSGYGKITRKLDLLNTSEFLEIRKEAKRNDNAPILPSDYDINGTWDTTRYTDWQDELLGGSARYTDIQASVSGGSGNTRFLIGSGYHRETTVFPGDLDDQKASLHFNINNTSINQKFRLQLSGMYFADRNNFQGGDYTNRALRLAPNAPALYNTDGSLNWQPITSGTSSISSWTNPLSILYNKYKLKTNNLVANSLIGYKIIENLELKCNFGYTNLQSVETLISPHVGVAPEKRPTSSRGAQYANNNINSWIIEPQLEFKYSISKGKLEVLLGSTFNQKNSNGERTYGIGYNSDAVLEDKQSAATLGILSTTISTYKYNAIFGRLNYNWLDKYIINLNARRDGSSRFGTTNTFHNFGSIGGAWVFSNENYIAQKLAFISFGKLRASYGTTGNDQIGDYMFMNLYSPFSAEIPYGGSTALTPDGLPNPHLQWEKVSKLQFGIDLGFFLDRILINANYYNNRSSNQLLSYILPLTTGFSNIPLINFPAVVRNSGWELTLSTTNINSRHFKWNSSFNITIPQNKLVDFPNLSTSSYASSLVIGEPITITPVFRFAGVDPSSGLYTFVNKNGNKTSSPNQTTDKTVFINPAPKFYGGFQNTFSYKGIELDFLLQFTKQVGPNYNFGSFPGFYSINQPKSVLERWRKPGDNAKIQKVSAGFGTFTSYSSATNSDAAWSDASFVRLKNVSLSWQLPNELKRKVRLQQCRIFIQGQNLLTITNYDGMDPENKSFGFLPPLRVLTFGLNVGL